MPTGSGDRWVEDYERGRPGWPVEALDVAGLAASSVVIDLGAGTGKLTRLLVRRFARVVAVEPAEPMRRMLESLCPQAETLAGTGQEIPLANASVDCVFAAEAFHWFDDERAAAEIARILCPGGALVLLWNVPAGTWEPSTAAAEDLLAAHGPAQTEAGYDPLDLAGPRSPPGESALSRFPFEPFRETRIEHPQTLDRDGLVAYYASMGWLADLPDRQRLPLLEEVRELLTAEAYRRLWETHAFWTRRIASCSPTIWGHGFSLAPPPFTQRARG
jgi:SAM-dependent methyltransferase